MNIVTPIFIPMNGSGRGFSGGFSETDIFVFAPILFCCLCLLIMCGFGIMTIDNDKWQERLWKTVAWMLVILPAYLLIYAAVEFILRLIAR